jgi:hypothetical protein
MRTVEVVAGLLREWARRGWLSPPAHVPLPAVRKPVAPLATVLLELDLDRDDR